MKMEDLHKKIDSYFEAGLSPREERELLQELLRLEGSDPLADEALAVMLASRAPAPAAAPARFRHDARRPARRLLAVAASVAAVAAIGVIAFNAADREADPMFAYVGGVRIDDPHEIKKLVDIQLNDIGKSSELIARTVSDDLDDIRDALTSGDL